MDDQPAPVEPVTVDRPKMPSPFDRSKLKEQIQAKRTCSPVDLSKIPEECDQLLNLQPIIQQKPVQTHEEEEAQSEEIDCGDLFGSQ